jgi:carbamoyltransferase
VKILGIWDGHDAGAAIIEGPNILFAINEERLTRRKLEVCFPEQAIRACVEAAGGDRAAIKDIAISTSDFSKTLARIIPSLKEEYYLIRRRKRPLKQTSLMEKKLKYKLTEFPPSALTQKVSRYVIQHHLAHLGLRNCRLHLVDHHFCHAVAAAFCSGFGEALIVTLDGLGDGRSGSFSLYRGGAVSTIASLPARHSLGIFFEHVTNLMNMRELEDEGKVMALANYAYPIDNAKNPLLEMFRVEGLSLTCRYSSLRLYDELRKVLWLYPSEQFAYMAQRTLEVKVLELVRNAIQNTGMHHVCLAGGVFSNVKVNRLIRLLPEVKDCFVFPHMGDGGLAIGAALAVNAQLNQINRMTLDHMLLGPHYTDDQIEQTLHVSGLSYYKSQDIVGETAELIANGEIVFWFQGRMELGPRALGARSILARPDSESIKDTLNLRLKKRVWYQPFCPSMLEEDARDVLADYDGIPNLFMTMAYMVKADKRSLLRGVINVDGSCRPQTVSNDGSLYRRLLEAVKHLTGHGILLNTSFNLHGEPLVCTPQDAVRTMRETGNEYLAIGNFLVRQ